MGIVFHWCILYYPTNEECEKIGNSFVPKIAAVDFELAIIYN
nr:unnamed protein product [Callosobruchus analis]